MVDAVIGALRVDLAMNAGEFTRNIRGVKKDLSSLGSRIADISSKMGMASFYINSGMRAAQRFATASQSILTVSSDFERGMSSVATLIDTTTESLTEMSDQVLAIGRRTPVSLADLTTALYDIRSAGISAKDSLGILERSAQLAVSGLGTTKETVDLVTSSINAFGLQGQDAQNVFDQIFKTIKFGKTTISGLAQGFGAVAGTVANAGIKLDDYLASVAALTTTGLPAAQAHTQIRAAIAGLLRETTETKALFDALNVKTFKELVEQSGSIVTAFERISRATQGNDAQLIKLLGSVEAYNALIGLAGKQNAVYQTTIAAMRNGTDAVSEAFAKQSNTITAATQLLINNVQVLAVQLGNIMAPIIKDLADKVQRLGDWFKSLSPEMQETIAKVALFVGVIVPAVVAIGFFVNALAALIPVFAAVGAAIIALIAATGPIGLLIAIAATLSGAWYLFRDDMKSVWDSVSAYIAANVDAIIAKLGILARVMGQLATGNFVGAFDTINAQITRTTENVSSHTKSVMGMKQAWTTLTEDIPQTFNDGFVVPVVTGLGNVNAGLERAVQLQQQLVQQGVNLAEQMRTPFEIMADQVNALTVAYDEGEISAAQFGAAQQRAAWVAQNAYAGAASSIAGSLEQVFGKSKAVAIASALINSYQAFTNAMANIPAPLNIPAAAAALAAGLAQVANIRKTSKTGGGGGSTSGSGATAAAGPTRAPQQLMVQGISSGQMFSGDVVRDLANKLLDFQRDGGQVVLQ